MIKKTKGKISFFQSEKLADQAEVIHFFSTRNTGMSEGIFESLNFGTHHGEEENMKKNLILLSDALNLDSKKFVIPIQTHGDQIGIVDQLNCLSVFENTDALITNVPSIVLAIKTADCVPILLFDHVKKVIGAVHSGWKGTAQNIIGKTIEKMTSIFDSQPSDIIAAIGPCIGQRNYEVGIDVVQKIESIMSVQKPVFYYKNHETRKAFIDLALTNSQLLKQAGVLENKIETSGFCSFTMKNDFFSARRDGSITGRMINGISIKS
jgi:polyphenol oxidase